MFCIFRIVRDDLLGEDSEVVGSGAASSARLERVVLGAISQGEAGEAVGGGDAAEVVEVANPSRRSIGVAGNGAGGSLGAGLGLHGAGARVGELGSGQVAHGKGDDGRVTHGVGFFFFVKDEFGNE